ncbi:MAG: hypothetical protein RSE00_01015 [Clostridia bacterium]
MKQFKKGISLIVLIVTIVVMIIITGAIILSVTEENPIDDANETRFKTDVTTYRDELLLHIEDKRTQQARSGNTYYAEEDPELVLLTGRTASDGTPGKISTVLGNFKDRYKDKLEIRKGVLLYVGKSDQEASWAQEVGVSRAAAKSTKP